MSTRLSLMGRFLGVALACLALCPAARAEEAPPADAAAWALYDRAFSQVVAQQDTDALGTLLELRGRHPGTAAAALGLELERFVGSRQAGVVAKPDATLRDAFARLATPGTLTPPVAPAPPPAPRPLTLEQLVRDEEASRLARAELILFQTASGIALGLNVVEMLDLQSTRGKAEVVAVALGAAAGAYASYRFTDGGITPGHALAINSGTAWGFVTGVQLLNLTMTNDPVASGLVLAAGQLGGAALGHFAWKLLPTGAGDVSLANSGGIWSAVIVALLPIDRTDKKDEYAILGAGAAGLVGGALLSRYMPMTRSRVLLLDVGGIAGGLAGLAVVALRNLPEEQDMAIIAGGVVAGLAASGILTRNWDTADLPVSVGVAPTQGGAMVTLSLAR